MYQPKATLVPLPRDAILWKYLDFTKFVSLLDKSALHFARTDKLSDPYEGFFPRSIHKLPPKDFDNVTELHEIMRSSILVRLLAP